MSLDIPRDRLVNAAFGGAGKDFVNNGVHLSFHDETGSDKTVYVCDGSFIGPGGLLGRGAEIARAVQQTP